MKTTNEWLQYFQQNPSSRLEIPWERGADLTLEERAAVARSVQEFQLGESSEGRHLIQDARAYSARTADHAYPDAMRYFILEEQHHSLLLGRFLELNAIPRVSTTLLDRVFRSLRNLFPGLELTLSVLVVAELIAKVYYAALRRATCSAILRQICQQLLRDEVSHVSFQAQQLARLRAWRGRVAYTVTMAAQRVLYFCTVLIVWFTHRSVMQRAEMTRHAWCRACWRKYDAAFSAGLRSHARLSVVSNASARRDGRSALAPESA